MSDSRLEFLRELERMDEEVAATLAELDELAASAESVRRRAVELEAFLVGLPAERELRARRLQEADDELAAARAAVARAQDDLEAAEQRGDDVGVAAARRFLVRLRDRAHAWERRNGEARAAAEQLEREAREADAERAALEERAREIARQLAGRARLADDAGGEPAGGLAGVSEWGSRARAALFVARGGLAAEREAVIRQANELGSLVLGEPLTSASAAAVTRRVEESVRRGT